MIHIFKFLLYLIPYKKNDVLISMFRVNNNTGPSRFINYLKSNGKLKYSKFGLIRSRIFFVISNSNLAFLILAKILRKKIIVRVDGFSLIKRYEHVNKSKFKTRIMSLRRLAMNYQMSLTQYYADHVIFQSKFSKEMSSNFIYPLSVNNSLIYNGVDQKHFNCQKKFETLNISILGNFRDVDLMYLYLMAFQKLYLSMNNCQLFIIGSCNSEVESVINNFIQKNNSNIFKNIRIVGKVNYEELPYYLSMTNVGWHFTLWDWCPNSVLEQMASGNPIICSSLGGTSELVGTAGKVIDIKNLSVSSDNLDLIYSNTIQTWNNIKYFNKLALERVNSNFSINKMVEDYEQVFKHI